MTKIISFKLETENMRNHELETRGSEEQENFRINFKSA